MQAFIRQVHFSHHYGCQFWWVCSTERHELIDKFLGMLIGRFVLGLTVSKNSLPVRIDIPSFDLEDISTANINNNLKFIIFSLPQLFPFT